MKKLFLSLALGLGVAGMANAAETPYDITWSSGTSYSSSLTISNMTVPSLSTVWGTFPEGTLIGVGNNKPVYLTGPNGFTRTCNLGQASSYDPVTEQAIKLPAIKITFADAPLSVKVPGVYTATIPASSFSINGVANVEFTTEFNIEDTRSFLPVDLEITPDPAPGQCGVINGFNIFINNTDENGSRIYSSLGVKYGAKATLLINGTETREYDIVSRSTNAKNLKFGLKLPEGQTFWEPGTYTVTYPEGSILLQSQTSTTYYTNKTLVYNYYIAGEPTPPDTPGTNVKPGILPAEGSEITALAGIEMECPEGYLFKLDETARFNVNRPDGSVIEYQPELSPNNMYLYLRGEEIEFAPGAYTVNVPKGAFSYVGGDSKAVPTNGFDIKYDVKGGNLGDLAYTLSDEEGDITGDTHNTYSVKYFYLKFNETVTPTQIIRTKVVYPDGSVKYASTSWSSANQRFLIFMNYPSMKGRYEITIPAAIACADGVFNKEIKFTVNYLDKTQEEIVCTTTPENGSTVSELNALYVNLDPTLYSSASLYLSGITKSYFANDDDPENPQMQYLKTTTNPLQFYILLDETVKEKGDYSWTIPENSFVVTKNDGTQVLSTAMKFFWSIRGGSDVAEAFSEDVTLFTVYDANGVCVLKDGSREDLKKLGKGMFIINGKSFILR